MNQSRSLTQEVINNMNSRPTLKSKSTYDKYNYTDPTNTITNSYHNDCGSHHSLYDSGSSGDCGWSSSD